MGFMDSLFAAVANRSGNPNVAALGNVLQRKPSGGNNNTPQSNANSGGSWANLISQIAQRSQGGANIPSLRQQQYEAPASYQTPTTQSAAPAKQDQKQATKEEKQERKTFNDALANALGGMMFGGASQFLNPETAEGKEPEDENKDKEKEAIAPNVTVEGSNDANTNKQNYEQQVRDAMGDEAYGQLQQGIEAGKERQADRKAAEQQREQAYQDMLGVSPQAQLDRAMLEQEIARASAQQDRDLLMSGVTDEDAKARYDASLNQSAELRDSEVAEQIKNAAKEVNAEKTDEDKAAEDLDEAIKYYISEARPEGYTKDDLSNMYEDAIYNAAMANEDYRKLFDEAGYGDYGSYAAYGSLGDTLDYDSRREITRDIFGLDDTQPDLEIQGLKDIYFENGTINDKMTPDEMLDAILEAHWGAGNIINPYQWMTDEAYQAANPFNGSSAAAGYTDYWQQSEMLPADVFANLSGDWGQLDDTDFATLVAAGNILNQINNGWKPSDADLEAMSQLFQNAGDLASFAYLPDDGSESEYKGRDWTANRYANAYTMPQLLQTMAAANDNGDYSGLTPYVDSNMALGDAYMTDTIAKAIEDSTGKKVGRKDR